MPTSSQQHAVASIRLIDVIVSDVRTWRLHIATLSSLLCSDFAARQPKKKKIGHADVRSQKWLQCRRAYFRGLHVAGLQQQEPDGSGSSDLFSPAPMDNPHQNALQSSAQGSRGVLSGTTCRSSRRYFCTGGCTGRSLWDPSLLQRRNCENDFFFTPLNLVERQEHSHGVPQLLDSPALCSSKLSISSPILRKWQWGISYRRGRSASLREVFLNWCYPHWPSPLGKRSVTCGKVSVRVSVASSVVTQKRNWMPCCY